MPTDNRDNPKKEILNKIAKFRKHFKNDISDQRLNELVGYLEGVAEAVIREERKKYEQIIKSRHLR